MFCITVYYKKCVKSFNQIILASVITNVHPSVSFHSFNAVYQTVTYANSEDPDETARNEPTYQSTLQFRVWFFNGTLTSSDSSIKVAGMSGRGRGGNLLHTTE